jgi:CheY-like chemotaxis protein
MPAEAAARVPTTSDRDRREATARAKGTVLVVDDDVDIRESTAEILEEDGYSVVVAEDGQQAFDYLASSPPPACVLLDLWMPVRDGWWLAAELKSGRLPAVPILVITAAGGPIDYPVPARYVVRKPFELDRLLKLVAEVSDEGKPHSTG